jgi:hypothetical protein
VRVLRRGERPAERPPRAPRARREPARPVTRGARRPPGEGDDAAAPRDPAAVGARWIEPSETPGRRGRAPAARRGPRTGLIAFLALLALVAVAVLVLALGVRPF